MILGKRIREIFERSDRKLSDFAQQIGTVRQNVYRIFERESIDTQLLLRISEVLDHDFFQYCKPVLSGTSQLEKPDNQASQELEVEVLNRQLESAKKEVEFLRKIIQMREEEKSLVESKLKIQLDLFDAVIVNLREKEKKYVARIKELEAS